MDFKEKLKKYFNEYQIEINDNQINQFSLYYNLLIEWNNKFNLTNITDEDEVITKHFIDCLQGLKYFKDSSKIIDVGAGAGFPSIPLKIMNPSLNITMLDSLNKRIVFLNEVIDKLKLKDICAIHSRAEDYAKNNFELFDYATARAVAKLNTLLEYLLPFVKVGGKVIALKGDASLEIIESKNAISILGGKLEKIYNYDFEFGKRNIVIIDKIKNTNIKYPRGKNLPRVKPL